MGIAFRLASLIIIVGGAVGCSSLPPAHIYTKTKMGYQNDGYRPERRTASDVGTQGEPWSEGRDFCRDVENRARVRAVQLTGWGWALGILSAVSIGAGTILAATPGKDPSTGRTAVTAALPVSGAALGYISFGAFSREKDSSELAATAAAAVNLDDERANETCNAALRDWNSSRPNASRALLDALKAPPSTNPPPPPPPPASPSGSSQSPPPPPPQ